MLRVYIEGYRTNDFNAVMPVHRGKKARKNMAKYNIAITLIISFVFTSVVLLEVLNEKKS